MNQSEARGWHSRGYLPHFDEEEILQFITFRLYDSLPQSLLEQWRQELSQQTDRDRGLRRKIETYLDKGYGCIYLKNPRIATMVQNALLYFDGTRYRLTAWVIMPNHVHVLLTPFAHQSLSRIMQSIKSYTAQEANQLLNRTGQFWMQDYFDRFIRDEAHYHLALAYIENNPVKSGLCASPSEWIWSSSHFRTQSR